jgi:L-glyceraldehyde 3-phosphate reductase
MPDENRYQSMTYARCGRSGIQLPRVSLGLWHNFGEVDSEENARAMILRAFDLGITHFDLANNYGPPPGTAEMTFGRILRRELWAYRDEMIISTKAGYLMWPGPYGEWGSRKSLLASLDQSLKRLGLEYVDIFYSHRFDPKTPIEETVGALAHAVRCGKALYAGISSYGPKETQEAIRLLRASGTPLLIHQPKYSLFERWVEKDLLTLLAQEGVGCIAFSPLAQGLLAGRYLSGIPADSRAAKPHGFLKPDAITPERITSIKKLSGIARRRGDSLAQLAISWVLRRPEVTSALIGASRVEQIEECVAALGRPALQQEELAEIERATA